MGLRGLGLDGLAAGALCDDAGTKMLQYGRGHYGPVMTHHTILLAGSRQYNRFARDFARRARGLSLTSHCIVTVEGAAARGPHCHCALLFPAPTGILHISEKERGEEGSQYGPLAGKTDFAVAVPPGVAAGQTFWVELAPGRWSHSCTTLYIIYREFRRQYIHRVVHG